jgi:NADH-quinone oxidoreductase subunit L
MRLPVMLLALAAAVSGLLVLWSPSGDEREGLNLPITALALVLTALGGFAAWRAWQQGDVAVPDAGAWLDAAQSALVVRPVLALARAVRAFDVRGVGGVVLGTGRGALALGRALARANAAGLAGYVTTALGGGVLLALVAVVVGR